MSSGMFEITHDSLAAKIWEKVSAEEKTLIEVKNFIANSMAMPRKMLLTKEDLAYIAPHEGKLTLDANTLAFIRRSKRFYRNRKISTIATIGAVIISLAVGLLVIRAKAKEAVAQKVKAEEARAKADTESQRAQMATNAEKIAKDSAIATRIHADASAKLAQTRAAELDTALQALRANQNALFKSNRDLRTQQDENRKQIADTKQTLENTKLLAENPTQALAEAVAMYDTILNADLKNYLKQNAFDAYNQVLYTHELQLSHRVLDLAVSYDHKSILIADSTRTPKVWNLATNTVRELFGPVKVVTMVEAASHTPHFVTVEDRKELILWNGDYEYLDTANFRDEIRDIKYINGEKNLLMGFKKRNVAITDLRGKTVMFIHDDNIAGLEELAAPEAPGYDFITRNSDDKIRYWHQKENTKTFEDSIIFDNGKLTGKIYSIALSPDADQLSLGTERGIYCAHAAGGRLQEFHFEIYFPSITRITFKSNNELIVSTATGTSFIYDVERKEYREVKGYSDNTRITQLKSFREDRHFITAGDDRVVKVWDTDLGKSLFFRSAEDNPYVVNEQGFSLDEDTRKWALKIAPGDIIYFRNDRNVKPRKEYGFTGLTSEVEWDTTHLGNTLIRVTSPVSEYNDMYFYESAEITEDSKLLTTIKISDMAGGNDKKMKNRLNIKSVIISDCKRFVLIKCTDRTARYFYYCIYPTFEGLYDLVRNKKLLKTRL